MKTFTIIKKYKNILTLIIAVFVVSVGMQFEMKQAGEKSVEATYSIGHSLRFRANNSAYMSRTNSSTVTSNTVWTYSGWIKLGAPTGQAVYLLGAGTHPGTDQSAIKINGDDTLEVVNYISSSVKTRKITSQLFRDHSAWFHIVVSSNGATATNIYINGVQITNFSTNTGPDASSWTLASASNNSSIGFITSASDYFDGYMSDIFYVDGQALNPTSFGETSMTTGGWVPKAYSGTYGSNGFHLDFIDGTSTTTLGYDSAGSNNWTLSGFSASSTLTSYDWMTDTPTKNFATMNPLDKYSSVSFAKGNLYAGVSANIGGSGGFRGSIGVGSGKWYWEVIPGTIPSNRPYMAIGVDTVNTPISSVNQAGTGQLSTSYIYRADGKKDNNASPVAYGTSYVAGDIIGVALDMDSGSTTFYKNGVSQGVAFTGISGVVAPSFSVYTDAASSPMSMNMDVNFGQRPFAYTPPAGYNTLSTDNLPEPTILKPSDHFDAVAYVGNGGYQMLLGNLYSNPTPSYDIAHSLRFRASVPTYLSRTFGTPTDGKTWTLSFWIKRGQLFAQNNYQFVLATAGSGAQGFVGFGLANNADELGFGYGGFTRRYTKMNFRDTTAWQHVVLKVDTATATEASRAIFYVNGIEASMETPTAITQNDTTQINQAVSTLIGNQTGQPYGRLDGYLSDIYFVDGQALTPSFFGQEDATTGAWVPKAYSGSYGTNGFHLDFTDGSSTTTLGYDSAGSNDWTLTGFSASSTLTTYDVASDTPTENYAVWSQLDKGTMTVTDGGLTVVPASDQHAIRTTMPLPRTGKWYWETTVSGLGYGSLLGIAGTSSVVTTGASSAPTRTFQWGSWFDTNNSGIVQYGTNQGYSVGSNWSGASQLTANDTVMIAVDMDNGSMWVGKNGTWFNSSGTANPETNTDPRWTGLSGATWYPYYSGYSTVSPVTIYSNFGQRPFKYTPPSGFSSFKSTNLTAPTTFDPGLVWIKNRTTASTNHGLYDVTRGSTLALLSNSSGAESAVTGGLVGFNKGGFSIGSDATVNTSGSNYIAWNWKAGDVPITNTAGSVTSTVSANPTAGFSIATFTGTGSAGTIGHGLNATPTMAIFKSRDNVGTTGWNVWHQKLAGANYYLDLSTTAFQSNGASNWSGAWSTTTFGLTSTPLTSGADVVAYIWSEIDGFSKFGNYTGNGSADGPFVYTGFKPRWIMTKRFDAGAEHWNIFDTERAGYNPSNYLLYANLANADDTTTGRIDILSNGFKPRDTGSGYNTTGATYVYAAFAEIPFKYSTAGATTVSDAQIWFGMDF